MAGDYVFDQEDRFSARPHKTADIGDRPGCGTDEAALNSTCDSTEIAGTMGVPTAFASHEVIGVLGMHRSGTSLCMDLLRALGVRLDDDLIPGDANNEPGYFESREIVDFNDGILRTVGATWHTVFSLSIPGGWADDPALLPAKKALRDLITRKAVNGPGTWGFKDPRTAVLLPLYEQVFAECGLRPKYILCIRDPRAVARSLKKRDQLPPLLSELLWLDYTMSAVQLLGERLQAIVSYEKWFRDAIGQAESLVRVVGPGAAAGSLETIVQRVVAPVLNHADAEAGDFALACSRSVYELLLAGDLPRAAAVFAETWEAIRLVMGPAAVREALSARKMNQAFGQSEEGQSEDAANARGFTEQGSARGCVSFAMPGARGPRPQFRLDPAPEALRALTIPPAPDAGLPFTELRSDHPGVRHNDCEPCEGRPNSWRAVTPDPWIVWPTSLCGSTFRFFVLVMSCSSEAPEPCGQLFWSGADRPGFSESLSLRFPVQPDRKFHTYILDLHAGADPGVLNYLWWHQGKLDAVRLDPLDAPGEFTITVAGFAHQDLADSVEIREALCLLPLRTELSYRYLRGSGIEIGALQNPLTLRQDTHIRYADRLTVEEARSHYPELDRLALVTPAIVCDATALTPVAARSIDFVIANHVLQHLTDPLSAIQEWLRVVRPGGYAYVAVPDHANPLDRLRPITQPDHLIADFEKRGQQQDFDREHYREWVASTRPALSNEQRAEAEAELVSKQYAIHFHTFSRDTFAELMEQAAGRFSADVIECRRGSAGDAIEYIAILRKA
jgi:SAM-dependent methyltransferase